MHLLDQNQTWDPYPATARLDETAHRRDAHRAIGVSAAGLALTGLVELAIAVTSGSVGLLGDALHNLSDVSTSAVVFVGFRLSKRPASATRSLHRPPIHGLQQFRQKFWFSLLNSLFHLVVGKECRYLPTRRRARCEVPEQGPLLERCAYLRWRR